MPFPECHMRGIKQWLAFCSWLLSFPTQCLGVIRVVTCIRICSCWSLSNIPCVNDHNLFMADGYLGCFQLLVVMIEYSYKILCEHKVSFPLHKYLRVWLLGQIVSLYLNSQQTAKLELIFGEWTVFLCDHVTHSFIRITLYFWWVNYSFLCCLSQGYLHFN